MPHVSRLMEPARLPQRIVGLSLVAIPVSVLAAYVVWENDWVFPPLTHGYGELISAILTIPVVSTLLSIMGSLALTLDVRRTNWREALQDPAATPGSVLALVATILGATFPVSVLFAPLILGLFLLFRRNHHALLLLPLAALAAGAYIHARTISLDSDALVYTIAFALGFAGTLACWSSRRITLYVVTLAMSWIFFPPIPARGWERAVAAVLYATLSLLLLRGAPGWLTWRSTVVPAFCINLLALMRFAGFAEMSVAPARLDTRARLVATSAHPGGKRCPLDMIERPCGLTLIGSVAEECGLSAWGEGGELLWHRPMSVGPIAAADCPAGRLYVASHSEHSVLELAKDGAEMADVALPRNANVIQSLGDRKVLVQTEGRELIRVDFASRSLDVLASLDNTTGFGFDAAAGRVAIARDGQLAIVILRTGETANATRLPEDFGFRMSHMTWCLEAGIVVTSDFETGRMYSFVSDDLRLAGQLELRPGIRNMACLGDQLVVANYATGHLTVLDPLTLRVVDNVYAGPRMRAVWIDPSRGALYTATAIGAIEYPLP